MPQVLLTFTTLLTTSDGRRYRARACGDRLAGEVWEGWVEFIPDAGPTLRSGRETTQPNLTDLEYWATGLSPVYLEGALERALTSKSHVA